MVHKCSLLMLQLIEYEISLQHIIDSNFYLQFAHEYTNYNDYFKKVEERIIIKELYVILKIIDYKPEVREIYNKYK